MSSFTLGALDFSAVFPGSSTGEALWNTLELAPYLESLGYVRYWLGEHHSPRVAHSSPELLVSLIAGLTDRMKVGTAGVLLRLHSPLKVAKDFQLLEAVYPSRIDLGIARGSAAPPVETLLRDGATHEINFEDKVTELLSYVRGSANVAVHPRSATPPEVWLLGSNKVSMQLAAAHATAFCYAHFIAHAEPSTVINAYREQFRASPGFSEPKCSIALAGICASSDNQAQALTVAEPPVSVVQTIIGSAEKWRREIESLKEQTGVTEFVILDMCQSDADKRNSYRLLAEAILSG
ncbi:MAG: MsnO8 family LLM class oxidoreductase [Acidobacteriaceae bacterium]|nr:MsnO8 family LLM class oxidoreductase [Acidobacteriaceae bacterium]